MEKIPPEGMVQGKTERGGRIDAGGGMKELEHHSYSVKIGQHLS